jgi:hypothetical protein
MAVRAGSDMKGTCADCGTTWPSPFDLQPESRVEVGAGIKFECPKCGGKDATKGRPLLLIPVNFKAAKDVVDRLERASNAAELARLAYDEPQQIRTGKDLATAKSQGKLKTWKHLRLMPRNPKEVALYAGIPMAVTKFFASRGGEEKPTVHNIVNIYQMQGTV